MMTLIPNNSLTVTKYHLPHHLRWEQIYHDAIGMAQDAMKKAGVHAADGVVVIVVPDVSLTRWC